jgi:P4 family phage/plasmid primase-like protien
MRGNQVINSLDATTARVNGAQKNGNHAAADNGHAREYSHTVTPENIPDVLKEKSNWVCWKLQTDTKGRATKIPYRAGGTAKANATDSATWSTFASCLATYEAGKADGVGFVVTPESGITGVDLDGCRNPETGELHADAAAILESLDTYAEISPSGTGVRAFIVATLPRDTNGETRNRTAAAWKKGAEKAEIELYDTARYFTVTGDFLGAMPRAIEPRQSELNALHARIFPTKKSAPAAAPVALSFSDSELLEKAFAAKNGRKIRSLYGGDATAYGSASEAESAFCCCLAFYTRDAAQITRLWKSSGLMREKANRDDYVQRTIANALATVTESYAPTSQRITQFLENARPLREITSDEIPAPALTDEKGNAEYDPAQLLALIHPHWPVQNLATNAAHAQRIRDLLGADLCYNANLGWLVYNGRFWQRDDKHATRTSARVVTLTQAVCDESATLYHFAAQLAQAGRAKDADAMSKAAKAHGRHTKQVESKAFIEGALHLAAGILAVETELFDQKPWVIGFQNGTWDKGVWREHRREDYLLHLSPVHLNFEADRSEWMAVLNRITGADSELALMTKDVCGYIFSAASHLRLLPFFYGPKGTGKSTVAELLQTVLGHMSATIDPKKLQDDAARERLGADLWNRRLAICSEAGSQKLAAELLKTLSGSDALAVRFLFREAFTAPPRHVLLMVTNDPPRMDAYDDALKDRVIALPFVHALNNGAPLELTGGKRIEAVRKESESPLVIGFAAWAMEGLTRVFQSQEIHRAKCVETATAQFWADTDPITPFWETVEESELLAGIGKTELRKRYEEWCDNEGVHKNSRLNRTAWVKACNSRSLIDQKRTGGKRFWALIPEKVAQVAQLSTFSKDTRESDLLSHGQFENDPTCATCATNESEAF